MVAKLCDSSGFDGVCIRTSSLSSLSSVNGLKPYDGEARTAFRKRAFSVSESQQVGSRGLACSATGSLGIRGSLGPQPSIWQTIGLDSVQLILTFIFFNISKN